MKQNSLYSRKTSKWTLQFRIDTPEYEDASLNEKFKRAHYHDEMDITAWCRAMLVRLTVIASRQILVQGCIE